MTPELTAVLIVGVCFGVLCGLAWITYLYDWPKMPPVDDEDRWV